VCDLETSRMGAPYIYDISRLRVKDLHSATYIYVVRRLRVNRKINDLYHYNNTSHVPVIWRAAIIFTRYSTASLICRFLVHRVKQLLVEMLPSRCAILHNILNSAV